jgi:predicted nucleic acid-binding protein
MAGAFLDTNVLLRHLLDDHVELSPKAHGIVDRIEHREVDARISDIVVFETVFVLERRYKISREEIARSVMRLLELPGILLPDKQRYGEVFELYLSTSVGFADCYHSVLMQRLGIAEVLSFDQDFDKLPGVVRREE